MTKHPKPTAASRSNGKGGHDRRRYAGKQSAYSYTTRSRGGVTFPNEDIGQTITKEQYDREGR